MASVCTLADHIRSANTNTVGFCPVGTSHDIITITQALPPSTGTITIEGDGHTISGDGNFRIFDVQEGAALRRDGTRGSLNLHSSIIASGSAMGALARFQHFQMKMCAYRAVQLLCPQRLGP